MADVKKTHSQRVGNESNSITGAKLLQGVEKSYDKGVKILDASEKTTENDGVRFSLREKPEPKETKKVYKMMRKGDDGKLYPLFIDGGAGIEVGKWYDADSPDMAFVSKLESGTWLVDPAKGEAVSLAKVGRLLSFVINL